jgi:hypothetical protein
VVFWLAYSCSGSDRPVPTGSGSPVFDTYLVGHLPVVLLVWSCGPPGWRLCGPPSWRLPVPVVLVLDLRVGMLF